MLNGIQAAQQIRNLVPESKIIFVSQESSRDIVQEVLNLGARGYVVKTRAAVDLLPAVEAVLEGRHFVSDRLWSHKFTDASPQTASGLIKQPWTLRYRSLVSANRLLTNRPILASKRTSGCLHVANLSMISGHL
jgi:DNA-binding NarL/FixJ family response regulator